MSTRGQNARLADLILCASSLLALGTLAVVLLAMCSVEKMISAGRLGYYDYMAMCCSQSEPLIVNDTTYVYYAALNFPHDVNGDQPGAARGSQQSTASAIFMQQGTRSSHIIRILIL
jgi:hypothetical protein